MNELKQEIEILIQKYPENWLKLLASSKEYSNLKQKIIKNTGILDSNYTISTRVYWIIHNIHSFEDCKCPVCGGYRINQNVITLKRGYPYACSRQCSGNDPRRKERTKNTCLKKYGSTNYLRSEEGNKKREDWLKKNGVSNAFQLNWVNEKANKSRKEHFGYEYTMQSPDKRRLASENYKKKTGYDSQFHDPKVRDKIQKTLEHNKQLGIDVKAKFKSNSRKKRYKLFLGSDEISPNFTVDDFCKLNSKTQYTTPLSWHCKKCGKDFISLIDQNYSSRHHSPVRCFNCHSLIFNGRSALEDELCDFVSEVYRGEIIKSDSSQIKPFELDIYIPEKKIAMEFDGILWHSEEYGKGKYYHRTKTEMCLEKGIQLIHVFEDEWLEKKEIVKSRIKNLIGIYDKTIYARKCVVKNVDYKTSMKFLGDNHIQGKCSSGINLGLYYNDELVSIMTFGKSRFDKKYEYELIRFCNKLGYHVPGAASRLLKHFENDYHPTSLVSYADRRWSVGNMYYTLGFSFDHNSEPDYFYSKAQKRYSRITFQKHKLKNLLEKYDEKKTEVENMEDNGYSRIFDCGNMVFTKTY